MSEGLDGEKVRFNDKLDHLQARHPFRYNLATGGIIALVVVLLVGFHWLIGVVYAVSWAGLRAYLWRDGRILRRQYDARVIRVAEERAAKRRRRA